MAELWEVQETDTPKSWEAFVIYRDMENRSLQKVADQLHKSRTIIGRWNSKHNWQERVRAWDAERDRLIRVELTRDIGKMRKRHTDLATAMLVKAAQALQKLPADEIKASDVSKMIETASKLERISRGDVGDVVEERQGGAAIDPVQFYIPDNGR